MLARGISSYQNASLTLKDGRSQEVEALTRINAEMERTSQGDVDIQQFYQAVSKNQKIWNEFLVALAEDDHPYPVELRARLISLAIWVNRHTQTVIQTRKNVEPLVLLNKDIIAGLQARPEGTAQAPGQQNIANRNLHPSSLTEKEDDFELEC
ncbi:MAG: flagellar biosynthesis regulator FlaF [Alphaproteobacteria bacterium]|nr:flagellar biosynthesis regulator FlaF [Alphaproteobacteria bacterium]